MFNLVAAALAFLLALAAILFGLTRIGVFVIEPARLIARRMNKKAIKQGNTSNKKKLD